MTNDELEFLSVNLSTVMIVHDFLTNPGLGKQLVAPLPQPPDFASEFFRPLIPKLLVTFAKDIAKEIATQGEMMLSCQRLIASHIYRTPACIFSIQGYNK